MKVYVENKKAYFDYEVLEEFEAGISLNGQEVKSIKLGRANLSGSFVIIRNGEAFLIGCNIPPYQPKNAPADYEPERNRKLLLKKSEIKYLIGKTRQKGLTLIPIRVYSKNAKIKVLFGVAKHRKKFDKRETIKKREQEREMKEELNKGG